MESGGRRVSRCTSKKTAGSSTEKLQSVYSHKTGRKAVHLEFLQGRLLSLAVIAVNGVVSNQVLAIRISDHTVLK